MSNSPKQGTHLFIDTNVLLSFFAYTKDDLVQLEKLVEIVKTKVVKLYLTQQVVDEFYRNREVKLQEAFEKFRPAGQVPGCPRFMTSLPEYAKYDNALKGFNSARASLVEAATEQAKLDALLADKLFQKLVAQTNIIKISAEAYARAERRARLGNPPGKGGGTIGDETNWELLLDAVPEGTDLHVVTRDSDYTSKFAPSQPKIYLRDEWSQRKKGALHIYDQIGLFFKANYPDENFSLHIEKQASIDKLLNSGNFATTHSAIAALRPYIPFLTEEEAQEVVQGALENSQVRWIANDDDVRAFLLEMLDEHGKALSLSIASELKKTLEIEEPISEKEVEEGEEPPF